ncbi:hypothetical protein [Roseovarius sp.]|uniref:hypothetical protein n=1 Tax=Roseovarius sp. TaxID=1486281 RepID=UPI003BAC0D7F
MKENDNTKNLDAIIGVLREWRREKAADISYGMKDGIDLTKLNDLLELHRKIVELEDVRKDERSTISNGALSGRQR